MVVTVPVPGRALVVFLLVASVGAREKPLARVNVDLVQVEAVVTDSKGNRIAGLLAQDFEVLENGKPQNTTNFSFIPEGTQKTEVVIRDARGGRNGVLAGPPVRNEGSSAITHAQVKHTIAVVVDDLGLSDQSFARIHSALEQFVNQVQPSDPVALLSTSGRFGALQQLTADKRMLRAALAKFRSLPNHRTGLRDDDFTCVWFKHRWLSRIQDVDNEQTMVTGGQGDPRASVGGEQDEDAWLAKQQVVEAYNDLLTHADRSSVSINTIDARGLMTPFETAERHG